MAEDRETVRILLEAEPTLGAGDASKCLPGWIDSFCEWFEGRKGATLSHSQVSALAHTLIAARQRAKRLAGERDELKRQLAALTEDAVK